MPEIMGDKCQIRGDICERRLCNFPYQCQNSKFEENVPITIPRKENLITKHLFYSFISYMHIMISETSLVNVYSIIKWYAYKSLCQNNYNVLAWYNDSVKPIFHRKLGSRWVPNANETYTKNMKCTWPTPAFCVGTQRNLYSTGWRRVLAWGKTQLLGFASGKTRKMCVTQRQRYQHVGIFCVR